MNYLIVFLNAIVDLMERNPHILPVEWKIIDNTIFVRAEVRNKNKSLHHDAKIFLRAPKVKEQIQSTIEEIEEALNVDVDHGKVLSYVIIDECKDLSGKEATDDSNPSNRE